MKLFDVILKLIKVLTLVNSDEYGILKRDVSDWTEDAHEDSTDKLKVLYAKMHKGVLIRLLMPFAYFFMLKWVKDLSAGEDENQLY